MRAIEGPAQDTPPPYVLTGYGPWSTCTAWFVTLPVADAVGPATFVVTGASALAGKGKAKLATA